MKKIIDVLQEVMEDGFEQAGYEKKFGFVTVSNRPDLCQYQCNGAMAAAKQYKMAPFQIAEKVVEVVKDNDIFEKIEMVKPGFINITVSGKLLVELGKGTWVCICRYRCHVPCDGILLFAAGNREGR